MRVCIKHIPLRSPPQPAAAMQTVQDFRLQPAAAAAIHRTLPIVDNLQESVDNLSKLFVEVSFGE